jgi:VIT1/CCC1 family predicted Fe2+/Mn2+ transporter
MARDALGAHAHDELGISELVKTRPTQAALASVATFSAGAALPLLMVVFIPVEMLILVTSASSLLFLALLGGLAAQVGGASLWRGVARVMFWGALAMGITAGIGALFGTAV